MRGSGEGEEEQDSELEYLQEIRKIFKEDKKLFRQIEKLPKKARSAGLSNNTSTPYLGSWGGGGGSSYFRPDLLSSVSYSNGTTYTQFLAPNGISNYTLAPPGGTAIMSNFGFSNYGNGVGTPGLVVIVPYVGTPGSVAVGADARFLVV